MSALLTWLGLIRAFLRRDWVNETSYRGMVFVETLGVGSSLILFYSIGKLVGDDTAALRAYGGEYFPFALVGLAVSGYFSIALIAFSRRVQQAQTTGTLEAMFVTATPPTGVVLLSGAWDFLLASLRLLIFIGVGIALLGVDFNLNLPAALIVGALALTSFVALGLVAGAVILVVKRGDSIGLLANVVATVFGGVLFPVSLLPDWVRPVSWFVPLSWALDGLRRATLTGADMSEISGSLAALALSSALLVPLAAFALGWSIERVRRDGSLSHY